MWAWGWGVGCLGQSPSEARAFLLMISKEQVLNLPEKKKPSELHVFLWTTVYIALYIAALWATMLKYNISANLVRIIEQFYDKATSAVQMNGSIGEWFRRTVRVRQGYLLSATLFNIFLYV